jgi:hypothetical protein
MFLDPFLFCLILYRVCLRVVYLFGIGLSNFKLECIRFPPSFKEVFVICGSQILILNFKFVRLTTIFFSLPCECILI